MPLGYKCWDCRADDWRLGPRGGIARNIECNQCKARFNVAIWHGHVFFDHRIERESEGGSRWP